MFSSSCCLAATDTGNQLLAALPGEAWRHLAPDLERVELAQGRRLHEAGAALNYVYFPTTAVVSLVSSLIDGGSAEVAVVGNEGVVGVCAFMGGGGALSGGVVQTGGQGWRMRAALLANHATRHEAVLVPLLRYTQALFVQLAQNSACQRHHSLDQQLCCWLLQHQDRRPGSDVRATHERMADLLGVRRETVTAGAQRLQKSGLIRYARGHITILDREGLEAHSCECYSVVRSAYDRLHGAIAPRPRADASLHFDSAGARPWLAPALRQPAARLAHCV